MHRQDWRCKKHFQSISREDQDALAHRSHTLASQAWADGKLKDEVMTAHVAPYKSFIEQDNNIRHNSTVEGYAKLKPVFDRQHGSVTAANATPLTDGAVFAIICSEEFAKQNSLKPLARIVSTAVTGCAPEYMGMGPVSSTLLCLERAGWDLDEVDIFELNEAFSSQSLACIQELGIDANKVNLDGGAISIGHPLGASGARITCKAASLLNRTNSEKAIATMCIGGGMGIATALEKI